MRHEYFKAERSAKPGSFDESHFVNPKTGKFRFPKYRSPRNALVKVVDTASYREDIWPDLDPEEKRSFSIQAFECHFMGAEIEVDEFFETLSKAANPVFAKWPFLKRKGKELQALWWALEDEQNGENPDESPYVFADSSVAKQLLKHGFLQEVPQVSGQKSGDRDREYLGRLTVPALKALCEKHGQKPVGRKADLVARLLGIRDQLELPPVVRTTDRFDALLEELRDAYVQDVRESIDSWHPAVIEDVWEMVATDACDDGVEARARRILKEPYWAERLV